MKMCKSVARMNPALLRTVTFIVGVFLCSSVWSVERTFLFEGDLRPGTVGADGFGALGGTVSGEWQFDDESTGDGNNPEAYPLNALRYTTFLGVSNDAGPGRIFIANDIDGNDAYTIGSLYGIGGDAAAGLPLTALSLQMIDQDGTVFSSTGLPAGPPHLAQFESATVFATYSDGVTSFNPIWDVTSLTEPLSGLPFPWLLIIVVFLTGFWGWLRSQWS